MAYSAPERFRWKPILAPRQQISSDGSQLKLPVGRSQHVVQLTVPTLVILDGESQDFDCAPFGF